MSTISISNIKIHRKYKFNRDVCDLYLGDALDFLRIIQSGSASIIFLDPPFNLDKRYSEENDVLDNRHPAEYFLWMEEILDETIRVLAKGGALYLYHLPSWAMRFGAHLIEKLDFRHWIAISMKNGFARGNYLYPAHYALLYFTKGDPLQFSRPHIRPLLCRHCGGTVKDYGGYLPIIEEKGINLSDFWEDISPVRHSTTKLRSANQLPMKILNRVVEISGIPGSVFVDPFAGTGTGPLAALEKGLTFMACDIVEANCDLIHERILNSNIEIEVIKND